MFLDRMNQDEKCSFLALADAFIRCDEKLSKEETQLIQCLAREAGLSESNIPDNRDLATLSRTFDSRPGRVCALLELIGLGHADSNYLLEESQFVKNLATEWEINETELAVLENWVLRLLALLAEVQTIIDGKE